MSEKPITKSDNEFLLNNTELSELLFILSEFGKLARYHNFDIITGFQKPSINPQNFWSDFETRILLENPDWQRKLLNQETSEEIFEEINRYILILLERFIAGLSRQFLFGILGAKARHFSAPIFDFAMKHDDDLGNTDYRVNTNSFQQRIRKTHHRNFTDWLQRKFNPNFKSQKIRKDNFEGDWPFYADEVTIECRYNHWCVVTINGNDYALNGSAKGRYKLENAQEGGMAILGKSTTAFLSLAFELAKA